MSHSICVLIFKCDKDRFRTAYPNIPYVLSNDRQYIITPTTTHSVYHDQMIRDIILLHKLTDKVVRAETDYFGGVGEQGALYVKFLSEEEYSQGNMQIPYEDLEPLERMYPPSINHALQYLGVQRTNKHDEFDVIGLGRWRSNEDIV